MVNLALVQIQTLQGKQGTQASLAEVEKAVSAYNALNPKNARHVVTHVSAVAANTKGMQAQLALLATVARANGATMVRLGVHNAEVALCGTPSAIEATRKGMADAYGTYNTMVASAYNPAQHGNRVGFTNGWLCGAPAGMQVALGITAQLAYGVGYLFTFPAPGSGAAYAIGQAAGMAAAKAPRTAPKAPKTAKAPKALPPTTDVPTAQPSVGTDATTDEAEAA